MWVGKYATETFSFNVELFTNSFYVKRFSFFFSAFHKVRRLWEAQKLYYFIISCLLEISAEIALKYFSTYFR